MLVSTHSDLRLVPPVPVGPNSFEAPVSTGANEAAQAELDADAVAAIGGSFEVVLPGMDADEVLAVTTAANGVGLPLTVNAQDPTVRDVMRTLDEPEPAVTQAMKIDAERNRIIAGIRNGTIDSDDAIALLEALGILHGSATRRDRRRKLMKEIVKQLQSGALTPNTIQLAKQLGLERFLMEAVRELIDRRTASPQRVDAIAGMLYASGLRMERMEQTVLRNEAEVQAVDSARQLAQGHDPNAIDAHGQAGVGTALLALSGANAGTGAGTSTGAGASH